MMLPPVPLALSKRPFNSVPDFADLVRFPRSASPTFRPFKGKIPPKWHAAARKKGFTISGRIKDRLHVALLCHRCNRVHAKRISVVLGHHPECPHCIQIKRVQEAWASGARLLGRDPKSRHYGHYRLECGHQVRRQYHRVSRAAKGGHALGCETCREERYKEQARKFGWDLIGPAQSGKLGYRSFQHTCGQIQDIMIGNMNWGDCACKNCSPGRSAKPSCIYIFGIDLPGQPVIKLGYSVRPEKRLRHQLGIDKSVETEVLRVIHLPTGFDARSEEERAHKTLEARHPELVVPRAEYGGAINTAGEIYRPETVSAIHSLLDEIEARFPNIAA